MANPAPLIPLDLQNSTSAFSHQVSCLAKPGTQGRIEYYINCAHNDLNKLECWEGVNRKKLNAKKFKAL
ncbi:hypothetical protein Y1Q_0004789 [Alligator mississippiensis]|uniref:Uncharacterized protein n=1 Tax=Alligator mississippiensis TaxID=8496 RepID=A0A151NQS9_ALLMI|nr:hypothetical protein Y1Q_0004789 [Alligator mississippiensis]